MASSWITTPHLRPSPDAESSESHPGLLAHSFNLHMASSQLVRPDAEVACERMGPFAVSSAQISVNIREDGPPGLPSEAVLNKRPTLSAPAIVTLQVKNGPRVPSDVHADVSTIIPHQSPSTTTPPVKRGPQPTTALHTTPRPSMSQHPGFSDVPSDSNRLPKDVKPSTQTTQTSELADIETARQFGSPQASSSSSTFEPQILAFTPTTNSQAAAPVSEASSSPTMGSPQLLPLNQSLIQGSDIERGTRTQRPEAPKRSTTMKTSRTSRSISTIAQSEYTDMILEPISSWNNFWSNIFLWIILAGFLVLPSTFPNLETIVENADKNDSSNVHKVLHLMRHVSLTVVSFTCCGIGTIGLCILWCRMRHNCIWLLDSIFIPGMFNGLSGLISTFVNIYSQNGVKYGTTTIATLAATGGCAVICSGLSLIYWFKKRRVVRDHELENEKLKTESEGGGDMERITSS